MERLPCPHPAKMTSSCTPCCVVRKPSLRFEGWYHLCLTVRSQALIFFFFQDKGVLDVPGNLRTVLRVPRFPDLWPFQGARMCASFLPRAPLALSCKQQFAGEVDLGACVVGVQSLLLSKTPQALFGGGWIWGVLSGPPHTPDSS